MYGKMPNDFGSQLALLGEAYEKLLPHFDNLVKEGKSANEVEADRSELWAILDSAPSIFRLFSFQLGFHLLKLGWQIVHKYDCIPHHEQGTLLEGEQFFDTVVRLEYMNALRKEIEEKGSCDSNRVLQEVAKRVTR